MRIIFLDMMILLDSTVFLHYMALNHFFFFPVLPLLYSTHAFSISLFAINVVVVIVITVYHIASVIYRSMLVDNICSCSRTLYFIGRRHHLYNILKP